MINENDYEHTNDTAKLRPVSSRLIPQAQASAGFSFFSIFSNFSLHTHREKFEKFEKLQKKSCAPVSRQKHNDNIWKFTLFN